MLVECFIAEQKNLLPSLLELIQRGPVKFLDEIKVQKKQNFLKNQGWGLLSQFLPFCYISLFFTFVETHFSYWISHLYLTGVTEAQLLWNLSNMNVI